jgi:hypothetical protein
MFQNDCYKPSNYARFVLVIIIVSRKLAGGFETLPYIRETSHKITRMKQSDKEMMSLVRHLVKRS